MEKEIIKILSQLRPEFDFTESVNFIEEGMLDSFDIVRLVVELDNAYNISIDGTEIIASNFSSIENIISLLNEKGVKK